MKKKVIIVGAGIAGMNAAINLLETDYDVLVLEAKNNLGGRVYSTYLNQQDTKIDNGQHIMVGAYKSFFEFLEKIGTKNKLKTQECLKITFYDEFNKKIILDASKFPGRLGILVGLFNMQNLTFLDKLKYLKLFFKVSLFDIDLNCSAYDFLIKMEQSNRLIKIFWEPLILATINTSLEKASAKLLVNVLKKSFFSDPKNARIYIPKVDFCDLINPFEEYFTRGNGELLYCVNIKNASIQENKIIYIEDANGTKYFADKFIFAIPANKLQKIFVDLNDILINKNNTNIDDNFLQNSSITSIYLWYDGIFMEDEFCAVIDKNIQWIFNRNLILDKKQHNIQELSITISDSHTMDYKTQSEIMKIVTSEISELFPKSREFKLLNSKIIREKNATFTASNENEKKRPNNQTKIQNLIVAGDWTDTCLPATLESAAISGTEAVRLIKESQ